MGSPGANGGGNTGADQGFFTSEKAKKEKENDKNLGTSDYQGSLYSKEKSKTKNTTNNNNGGGNDGNNTITQVTKTAPTVSEVSQATTTEAEPDTEANRLLKIKKKGRSQSIISGSQGVTKTSTDYSLGKKSLLGQV